MLDVKFSVIALAQMIELKERAARSPNSSHAKLYQAVCAICRNVIGDPHRALRHEYALRGNLKGIKREKFGRYRIFFIVAPAKGRSVVLNIGYRKAGDNSDAYEDMERLVGRGEFNLIFDELDLPLPDICSSAHPRRASTSLDAVDPVGASVIAAETK